MTMPPDLAKTYHYGKSHPGDPDNTWMLWFDIFGDGESGPGDREVIIILDDDTVVIGKISGWSEARVHLKTSRGKFDHHVNWDRIRFMAHEGFPVRKILCPPQSKTMKKIRSLSRAAQLRQALKQEFNGTFGGTSIVDALGYAANTLLHAADRYKAMIDDFIVRPRPRTRSTTFGDPFCADFVAATLLNPGNHGPWWDDEPDEETLLLETEDGSRAMLCDLPSVLALV